MEPPTLLLRAERLCDDFAGRFESLTRLAAQLGVKRAYLGGGLLLGALLFLFVGVGAQLFSSLVGFAFPAYASFKAIESPGKDDDTQWLTYWVVFAVFSLLEVFADTVRRPPSPLPPRSAAQAARLRGCACAAALPPSCAHALARAAPRRAASLTAPPVPARSFCGGSRSTTCVRVRARANARAHCARARAARSPPPSPSPQTCKIGFLLWCQLPATRGAEFLYRRFLRPQLIARMPEIDNFLAQQGALVGGAAAGMAAGGAGAGAAGLAMLAEGGLAGGLANAGNAVGGGGGGGGGGAGGGAKVD